MAGNRGRFGISNPRFPKKLGVIIRQFVGDLEHSWGTIRVKEKTSRYSTSSKYEYLFNEDSTFYRLSDLMEKCANTIKKVYDKSKRSVNYLVTEDVLTLTVKSYCGALGYENIVLMITFDPRKVGFTNGDLPRFPPPPIQLCHEDYGQIQNFLHSDTHDVVSKYFGPVPVEEHIHCVTSHKILELVEKAVRYVAGNSHSVFCKFEKDKMVLSMFLDYEEYSHYGVTVTLTKNKKFAKIDQSEIDQSEIDVFDLFTDDCDSVEQIVPT